MERVELPTEEAVSQLQQMLETPIEHQAASFELTLLSSILQSGMQSLSDAENNEEAFEILRQIIKSAFVIGRHHHDQLV